MDRDIFKGKSSVRQLSDSDMECWLQPYLPVLADIKEGKIQSWRHDVRKNGPPYKRQALVYQSLGLFKGDQYYFLGTILADKFADRSGDSFKYVMDVLVPESLIRLTMDFYQLTYEEAEVKICDPPCENTVLESDDEDEMTKRKKAKTAIVQGLMDVTKTAESLLSDSDSSQEDNNPAAIIARANVMQKKKKHKEGFGKRKSSRKVPAATPLEISVCKMVMTESGKMKRDGVFVCCELKHDDGYDDVVKKASETLCLSNVGHLRLFKLRGALLPKTDEWSIGAFKRSLHYSSEAVQLGLGYLRKSMDPTNSQSCSQQAASVSATTSKQFSSDAFGNVEVGYSKFSNRDGWSLSGGLKSRREIWKNEAKPSADGIMSKLFQPEGFLCSVCYVSVDGKEKLSASGPLSGCRKQLSVKNCDDSDTTLCIVHQSPSKIVLPNLKQCCALFCIPHPCSYKTEYLWHTIPKSDGGDLQVGSNEVTSQPITVKVTPVFEIESDERMSGDDAKTPTDTSEIFTAGTCMEFTKEEVLKATANFDDEKIGSGGFGCVYLAYLRHTMSAVKRLTEEGEKAILKTAAALGTIKETHATPTLPVDVQMKAEISALSKFRHPNLVPLMGVCTSPPCIIYEYMSRGSLYHNLHMVNEALEWNSKRTDACRGLVYLHEGNPPVVHQDIKSLNILIDGHGRGRIGDFGFSWEVPQVVSGRSMFTAKAFARSEGYYPTELTHGQCGPRTDVYSLGVVTLETFTGLLAYSEDRTDRKLAEHCQDDMRCLGSFKDLEDQKGGIECPQEMREIFYKVIIGSVRTLSKRLKSSEVLAIWDSY